MRNRIATLLAPLVLGLGLVGCSCSDDDPSGSSGDASGNGREDAGKDGAGNANSGTNTNGGDNCGVIRATVRDFKASHVDFQDEISGLVQGLVATQLGDDRKPEYVHGNQKVGGIENSASFDEWYADVPGTNQKFEIELPLTAQGDGSSVYDNSDFFPLDGKGFGNSGEDQDGKERNFHFTTEIHTAFKYEGGEVFTFRGDDDLWMFIDGKLAIDLGGVHFALERTVMLDSLNLSAGQMYTMDIFHAERHTSESNFRIETTIECFVPVVL